MDRFTEEDFRRLAFDYLRGDLAPEVEERVEEHLVESEEFADHVTRLQELLQSPKKANADLVPDFDKDALFDRIATEINSVPAANVVQFTQPTDADEEPLNSSESRRSPLLYIVAAAALIAIGFAASQFWQSATVTPQIAEQTPKAPVAPKKVEETAPVPDVPAKPAQLAELELDQKSTESVRVFAGKSANWNLKKAKNQSEIDLEEGTVLVEFVPKRDDALELNTKHFNIRVLGTIFYASDDGEGSVGVVTGKVQVTPKSGEPITLVSGQEYVGGVGVRPMETKQLADAETHTSVEKHLDLLAEARVDRSKPKEATKPKQEPKKVVVPAAIPSNAPAKVWREEAAEAQRAGQYGIAAKVLERALVNLSANDPLRGAIRLDLSRIYINRLGQPAKAATHLKHFIESRPSDIATPTARKQYCKIVGPEGDPLLCVEQ